MEAAAGELLGLLEKRGDGEMSSSREERGGRREGRGERERIMCQSESEVEAVDERWASGMH